MQNNLNPIILPHHRNTTRPRLLQHARLCHLTSFYSDIERRCDFFGGTLVHVELEDAVSVNASLGHVHACPCVATEEGGRFGLEAGGEAEDYFDAVFVYCCWDLRVAYFRLREACYDCAV